MLWPEKREKDSLLGAKVPGVIDRTTQSSYIRVASGYIPEGVRKLLLPAEFAAPAVIGPEGIQIGPIPKGTPINLLANLKLLSENPDPVKRIAEDLEAVKLIAKVKHDLASLPENADDAAAKRVFGNLVEDLLKFSKCPDYVVNRGHYFGTGYLEPGEEGPPSEPGLSDADKRALIEFLKTF